MSQIQKGIFGALAIVSMFGAAQLASGHDLIGGKIAARFPEPGINRAAKADRAAVPSSFGQRSQTISVRPNGLADTSVLIRVPAAKEARNETRDQTGNRLSPPTAPTPAKRKTAVACEPVVSVLTEVAKLLEPGRCVT
jgi:hypothetical protein